MINVIKKFLLLLSAVIAFVACNKGEKKSILIVETYAVQDGQCVIEKVDNNDGSFYDIETFEFKAGPIKKKILIIDSSKSLYRLRVVNKGISIPFFFDNDLVNLNFDAAVPLRYSFTHSPLNQSIKHLFNRQDSSLKKIRLIEKQLVQEKGKPETEKLKALEDTRKQLYTGLFENYLSFADTVSNPSAFMLLYDYVDFGTDRNGQIAFVEKAMNRFKGHTGVARIYNDFMAFNNILKKEYQVGQVIPFVSLPDEYGVVFSTETLKGKMYLLNFWSTWCNGCMDYFPVFNKVTSSANEKKLTIINIALDAELDDWKRLIHDQNFASKNLIDTKMWRGEAAKTYCMDSIPFNFLISENGEILAKGVSPKNMGDTLFKYLRTIGK